MVLQRTRDNDGLTEVESPVMKRGADGTACACLSVASSGTSIIAPQESLNNGTERNMTHIKCIATWRRGPGPFQLFRMERGGKEACHQPCKNGLREPPGSYTLAFDCGSALCD